MRGTAKIRRKKCIGKLLSEQSQHFPEQRQQQISVLTKHTPKSTPIKLITRLTSVVVVLIPRGVFSGPCLYKALLSSFW